MIYRTARSDQDIQKAFQLSCAVFQNSQLDDDTSYKNALWFAQPDFSPKHLCLLEDAGDVVGVIRLVPKKFVFWGAEIETFCLSSVCIDQRVRGKGFSKRLNEFAIEMADSLGAKLVYLIARRAVDHYYPRFGFFGISSYPSAEISLFEKKQTRTFRFVNVLNNSFLLDYLKAYNLANGRCAGFTSRAAEDYGSFSQRLPHLKNIRFVSIFADQLNTPVGYVILEEDKVVEAASLDCVDPSEVLLQFAKQYSVEKVNLSYDHSWICKGKMADARWSYRTCTYGGHMMRVLNEESLLAKRAAILPNDTRMNSGLGGVEKVCHLLGVNLQGWVQEPDYRHFSLSFLDIV